jgi:AcrR family transcriptional regulator
VSDVLQKPAKSARKPKGEGHARRAEILAAAERIFVECGYEGATIRKIADEVGVSSTALYMHFRDKSEILLEICESAFAQMKASHDAVKALDAPPETKVRMMLQDYIRFGLANPNAYRLVFLTRPQEAEGAQSVAQRLGRQTFASFQGTVAELAAAGRLKGEAPVAAQTLWAGVHGVVSLIITKPYFDWAPLEVLTGAMLDALFDGLLKP